MDSKTESSSIPLRFKISGQMRYPVSNINELVSQTSNDEVNVFGAKIKLSRLLMTDSIRSFIPASTFPITSDKDLRVKALRAFLKFWESEIRKTNGTPIRLSKDKDSNHRRVVAFQILNKYKLIQTEETKRDQK
jgi:hypothetical protein